MPKTQKRTPLESYRRRMKRRGMVRVEVQVRKEDASLVRSVASALTDREREGDVRSLLRQHFAAPPARGLKALLAAAPLEGIELVRTRDTGRALDL